MTEKATELFATATAIVATTGDDGKPKIKPVPRLTGLPLQLFTPIFGGQSIADVAKELENYALHTGVVRYGPLAGCRMTAYAYADVLARGVLTIPNNPVQIIFRFDQDRDYLKIDMI